jgi:hypothetical protein
MNASHTEVSKDLSASSPWRCTWGLRAVCGLLGAGFGLMGVLPAAEATSTRAAMRASPVSAFCSRIPASKVSSIVGAAVVLKEAVVVKSVLECIYEGAVIVAVDKQPGIPAAKLASLAQAEATARTGFPAGTKVTFAALRSLGSTAFSWTATIDGAPFGGIGVNKGTTGYGVELSGKPRISTDERLMQLGMAA